MTNIEKIRAEIERLKEIGGIVPLDNREQQTGYESALIDIEIFLDSLESEKPMQEGLEEEIGAYFKDWYVDESDQGYSLKTPTGSAVMGHMKNVARHFAQWGADHTPLPEDTVLFNKGVEEGKRLMMDEAVEGTITCHNLNRYILVSGLDESLTYGDKVRIIILPKEN